MSLVDAASAKLPTAWGEFEIHALEDNDSDKEHIALTMGDLSGEEPVLVRIHSECLTGDALFSMRCDCGPQLEAALKKISEEGRGVLLYLRQEGRGIGLVNKIKAYALQDKGMDTVEANESLGFDADARDFSIAVETLEALGVKEVKLMTNNPRKVGTLVDAGLKVSERVPMKFGRNPHNEKYLNTKTGKLGHLL
ncbi:GTP cyclohydrolase II [Pleionea sp. CnH1-48]|uniref:GTP cyclohydrolase II n=1 Tax=Pleionea sp. CnH1-48 TaxID=2954494 RepID=UPI002098048D|nr:GTP cyclohydrolase II [Pleionea sp. CnH1-48]MCO7227349.1 GTP cyclohydrolase II [Pleionea sp. CnH1-48]